MIVRPLPFARFAHSIHELGTHPARRLALLTARRWGEGLALVAVIVDPPGIEVLQTALDGAHYPSFTPHAPQVHWFERAIHDFFGLFPDDHPRFKDLTLHEAWPIDFFPLIDSMFQDGPRRNSPFLEVRGEGVYEIPVGPIHAGIIEPGHFRFSCFGELVQNLEIRLGYQHRGVEERLATVPWRQARLHAEAASSDTAVGNALAHALAIEDLIGMTVSETACLLRAAALEIERVACHVGDLGGICGDIGFSAGAAIFGRLRGTALGLAERLSGSRFMRGFVRPGGVAGVRFDAALLCAEAAALRRELEGAIPLLLDNPGALDRMEGVGRVRPRLAREFGLVGPAGRASGVACDVRTSLRQVPYAELRVPERNTGDVLARVEIRREELFASLDVLDTVLSGPLEGERMARIETLPPDACGVGIVEAWRGELVHLVFTSATGSIERYAIKDPSFNNWTGLAIAARGELVSDFPLCNKSFGLSYSGNDL